MAGSNFRKFKRPEVLRELSFPLLSGFLLRFKKYLDLVGFNFERATEENFDYEGLADVLTNQFFADADDSDFFNAFGLIGAVSVPSMNDRLREYILFQSYKDELKDTMSTADMALLIYMHSPEELDNIEKDTAVLKQRSFAMFAARRDIHDLKVTQEHLTEFERLMNAVLRGRHCGDTAGASLMQCGNDEIGIRIRRGDSYKRQGTIQGGKKSKTIGFQPEKYNRCILNLATREIRICAPQSPQWLIPAICQNLGMALYNDFEAFSLPRVNDLERLKEIGREITYYRGSGITDIKLVEMWHFATPTSHREIRERATDGDLFLDWEKDGVDITEFGKITHAAFRVCKGSIERTIALDIGNRSGYDYDEFGISVDEWVRHYNVIRPLNQKEERNYVAFFDSDGEISAAI